MEFTVDRSILQNALAKTQGIIDRKTTAQVLSNILLEATDDGQINITCTDYDVMWSGTIAAEVVEAGAVATNGKQFYETIRNFQDGRVVIRTVDSRIKLICGASEATFTTFPEEDFPRLSEETDVETFKIPKNVFREMIDSCQFSLSNDEARPALNGAYFRVSKSSDATGLHLTMVTTDGHRLSKVERDLQGVGYAQAPADGIIHKKGIQELRRTIGGEDEEIEIGFVDNREILLRNDGGTLKVRQIDARYPNYEKVIPTTTENTATVSREALMGALRLSSSIAAPKTSLVKMHFLSGKLVVIGTNPDLGEGKAEIALDYEGPDITVGFNFRYLMDIASNLKDETLSVEFTDSGSQALFRNPSDKGLIYVVMPMRV